MPACGSDRGRARHLLCDGVDVDVLAHVVVILECSALFLVLVCIFFLLFVLFVLRTMSPLCLSFLLDERVKHKQILER